VIVACGSICRYSSRSRKDTRLFFGAAIGALAGALVDTLVDALLEGRDCERDLVWTGGSGGAELLALRRAIIDSMELYLDVS